MITALAAAKAYANSGAMGVGSIGSLGGSEKKGLDFGDLLKASMEGATKASKIAEHKIADQVAGKAELVDVVTAISSAEASLETVMSVRDQVISAYQEIMRMPI
ncbi:flagellar hook-basal body complex protein FliE [uncultured Caulobacter sp.]|uniref:flagellar hook-basal body complex protein FliE n=1 Tax=uncultured Caulobacter sp. TaxID=158749 RepID=UPI00261469FB|nr:flagellar hook-basal body complex protein FliE [uncultured Caulobacter sp.]